MKTFLIVFVLLSQEIRAAGPDHALFTSVLKDHVADGMVNYSAVKNDPRFWKYIDQLRNSDPESISDRESLLAYWINVYNAFTIKVICDHYPVQSIKDIGTGGALIGHMLGMTVWDKKFVSINGREYTLNQIEHEIIRPRFNEPRIHFALVCAAKSCPSLRREAYEGNGLDRQLDEDARLFFSQTKKNRLDVDNKKINLSKVFDWFGSDFEKNGKSLIDVAILYFPAEQSNKIMSDRSAYSVTFLEYDWSLNQQ